MKKHVATVITSLAVVGALAASGTVFAAQPAPDQVSGHFRGGEQGRGMMGEPGRAPGVFGTVASVSGNTITVTSKGFGPNQNAAAKTYTVDATNATIFKNNATSSVSAIATGDTMMAQGTINGTSVTAKVIRDGMPGGPKGEPRGMMGAPGRAPGMHATGTPENIPVIKGDGKPVVGGTVTAISGNTLTLTNKSGVTYTVDASSATIVKQGATSTISSVATGDEVIAQGAVNGNAVSATSLQDQGAAPTLGSTGTSTNGTPQPPRRGGMGGMFDAVGTFFHNMFGFF